MGVLEAWEEVDEVVVGPQDVAVDFGDDGAAGLEEAGRHLAAHAGHVVVCEDDVDLLGAEPGFVDGVDDLLVVGGGAG